MDLFLAHCKYLYHSFRGVFLAAVVLSLFFSVPLVAGDYFIYGAFGTNYNDSSVRTELSLFSDVNFSGFVWDSRFMTFNTGVSYTDFKGDADWDSGSRLGYHFSSQFFNSRAFPFEFYYNYFEIERDSGYSNGFSDIGGRIRFFLPKILPRLEFSYRNSISTVNNVDVRERNYYEAVASKSFSQGNLCFEFFQEEERYPDADKEIVRDELRLDGIKRFGKKHSYIMRGRLRNYQLTQGVTEMPEVETKELYLSGSHLFTKKIHLFNSVRYFDKIHNIDNEDKSLFLGSRLNITTAHNFSYQFGATSGSREYTDRTPLSVTEDVTSLYGGVAYNRSFRKNSLALNARLSNNNIDSNVHDSATEISRYFYLSFMQRFSKKLRTELRYQYDSSDNDTVEEDAGLLLGDPARYTLIEEGYKRNYHSLNLITYFRHFKRYPVDIDMFARTYETEQASYGNSDNTLYGIYSSVRNSIWKFRVGYTTQDSTTGVLSTTSDVITFNGTLRPVKKLFLSLLYRDMTVTYDFRNDNTSESRVELKASYYVGKLICDFSYIRRNYSNGVDISENSYFLRVRRNFRFRVFR